MQPLLYVIIVVHGIIMWKTYFPSLCKNVTNIVDKWGKNNYFKIQHQFYITTNIIYSFFFKETMSVFNVHVALIFFMTTLEFSMTDVIIVIYNIGYIKI